MVAATDKDDTNLLVCQVSKSRFGLENLVARANNPENPQAFEDLGIKAMSPILSTAVILDDMIERPEIFSLMEIGRGGDIIEVIVSNPKVVGKRISELKLPKDSLIALIRGGGVFCAPWRCGNPDGGFGYNTWERRSCKRGSKAF